MGLFLWLLMFTKEPQVYAIPPEPAPVCVAFCQRVCWQDAKGIWHCEQRDTAEK